MAARNPTAFTKWFDEEALLRRRNIVETVPDQILSGMEEILDNCQMVIGETHWPIRTNNTGVWAAGMEISRYHIEAPDLCGVDSAAGTVDILIAARVAVDNGYTGEIRYQSLVNGDSATRTFVNTTPAWLTLDTLTCDGDGVQEDIQIDLRVNLGDGVNDYAYLFGVFAYMLHQ